MSLAKNGLFGLDDHTLTIVPDVICRNPMLFAVKVFHLHPGAMLVNFHKRHVLAHCPTGAKLLSGAISIRGRCTDPAPARTTISATDQGPQPVGN